MKYSIGDLIIEYTSEARMIITGIDHNTEGIIFLVYLNGKEPVQLSWNKSIVQNLIEDKLWIYYPIKK